ncbi:MAG TPA: glycosyltransferase family 2 protein, partial [Candidatus Methanoperedens sp.]
MLEFVLWFISFVSLFVSMVWLSTFYLSKPGIVYGKDILQYPAVSLCVPAFNEEKTIAKTLNSLLKLDYPEEKLEILVIDDGSTDNTYGAAKAFLEKTGAGNIVIIQQKNAGKAAALNTALRKAQGDLFGCVDADSTVSEDSFKKIVPHFYDDRVAAVVSTIRVAQEKNFLQKLQMFEYILSSFFRKLFTSMESLYVTTGVLSVYRRQI